MLVPRPATGWLVPRRGRTTLCVPDEARSYREGEVLRLVDVAPIDMLPFAPHALDLGRDVLAHARGRRLHVVRGLAAGAPTTTVVKLGWRTTLQAVALVEGVVYAGGTAGADMLGWVDPLAADTGGGWNRMFVPPLVTSFGKAIDGFALHAGRLVAVDDIVLPQFLLVYDVRDPRAPRFLDSKPLRAHSSGAHVDSVASDSACIALLSSTANRGRLAQHVALYDPATLEERAVLHVPRLGGLSQRHTRGYDFAAVAVGADRLWIAACHDGVGVIELDGWLAPSAASAPIPLETLRFVPVPEGEVLRVVPVDRHKVLAVVGRRAPHTVVVAIDER